MIGESNTLEELLAAGAACIAEEWVRALFEVTEFDPDEVLGFMDFKKAAFLGHPYAATGRSGARAAAWTPHIHPRA